jgi:hypothetical protein
MAPVLARSAQGDEHQIKNARNPFPRLYQKHENVKKEITKLRKRFATDTREAARKDHFQDAPVLEVDRQIKQLLGESDEISDDEDSGGESWELPTPNHAFAERASLVGNFYGPDAENFDEDKLLARRIQVTKDMVALLRLCEPNRRGNRVNWNIDDQDDLLDQPEDSPAPEEETMKCPTNICIICCGLSRQSSSNLPPHEFSSKRQDSLRRHLIDTHLRAPSPPKTQVRAFYNTLVPPRCLARNYSNLLAMGQGLKSRIHYPPSLFLSQSFHSSRNTSRLFPSK